LKPKRIGSHPWQFLKFVSDFHKNRNVRTVNQSIGRSFNVILYESESEKDPLGDIIQTVRKLEKCSFSTMEEKFFSFILHGLNAGALHTWWITLTKEGMILELYGPYIM
jgi:hypothetical protein